MESQDATKGRKGLLVSLKKLLNRSRPGPSSNYSASQLVRPSNQLRESLPEETPEDIAWQGDVPHGLGMGTAPTSTRRPPRHSTSMPQLLPGVGVAAACPSPGLGLALPSPLSTVRALNGRRIVPAPNSSSNFLTSKLPAIDAWPMSSSALGERPASPSGSSVASGPSTPVATRQVLSARFSKLSVASVALASPRAQDSSGALSNSAYGAAITAPTGTSAYQVAVPFRHSTSQPLPLLHIGSNSRPSSAAVHSPTIIVGQSGTPPHLSQSQLPSPRGSGPSSSSYPLPLLAASSSIGPSGAQPFATAACTSPHPAPPASGAPSPTPLPVAIAAAAAASASATAAGRAASSTLLAVCPGAPESMRRSVWCLTDYNVGARVYKGEVSSVYKAQCLHSGVKVVLKVYSLGRVADNAVHTLVREVRIHSDLSHNNILMLFGVFEEENRLVLVLERAARGDLFRVHRSLPGCRMSEEQLRVLVLAPLLESLVYLHGRGIVHRDIKPENLLLTAGWQLRLADFGAAINIAQERAVTRTGTTDYMAPEVERCPIKETPEENKDRPEMAYTTAADVWSVGVLAYELLVGFPPFVSANPGAHDIYTSGDNLEHFAAAQGPHGFPWGQNGQNAAQHASTEFDDDSFPGGGGGGGQRELHFPHFISAGGQDFIAAALAERPGDRPTALQLLRHPWLKHAVRQAACRAQKQAAVAEEEAAEKTAAGSERRGRPSEAGSLSGGGGSKVPLLRQGLTPVHSRSHLLASAASAVAGNGGGGRI